MMRVVFSAFFGVAVGFSLSCNAQSANNVLRFDVPKTDRQIEQEASKQRETSEQTPPERKRLQTYEEYVTDQWTEFDKMTKDRN
jgi:iron uptake system EfeUOB component EfeO/EfeM